MWKQLKKFWYQSKLKAMKKREEQLQNTYYWIRVELIELDQEMNRIKEKVYG